MMEPETKWIAIETGRLILPNTKFEIRYLREGNWFEVFWDASSLGTSTTLAYAQERAMARMAELITMGFEA